MYNSFYIFVICLEIALSKEKQSGLIDSYIGSAKSAKLIKLIQRLNSPDNDDLLRRFSSEVKKDETSNYEAMKLLQKNYDTNKQFGINKTRLNVQYISNPEVLDIYRNRPSRRDVDFYRVLNSGDVLPDKRRNSYKYGAHNNDYYPNLHYLSNPGTLEDFRRLVAISKSPPIIGSTKNLEADDYVESSSDIRNKIKEIITKKEKDDVNNEPVAEIKLENAFDLVKPFFVQVFNKLKGKTEPEKSDTPASQDHDYPNKAAVPSNDELINKKEIENNILQNLFNVSEDANNDDDNIGAELKKLTNANWYIKDIIDDQTNPKGSWEEKSTDSSENYQDKKKLPASKKSFIESSIGQDDYNTGYRNEKGALATSGKNKGFSRETNKYRYMHTSNRGSDKGSLPRKQDSREIKKHDNLFSDKKRFDKKTNWDNYDKGKRSNENYSDRASKKKKQDDDWIKKDDQWNNKNQYWNDKDDNWQNKKPEWDKKNDWNSKKDISRNKKKDSWDTGYENKNKKTDDWDTKQDDYNKKDNWHKKDEWASKEDKRVKKKKDYPDWDKKQNNDDASYGKDINFQTKKWDKIENFKIKKDNPASYEDRKVKDTYKKGVENIFKPKIRNSWDDTPKYSKRIKERSGPSVFGRTPIPFRGIKAVYTD